MRRLIQSAIFTAAALHGGIEAQVILVPSGVTVNETVVNESDQVGIIDCGGRIVIEGSVSDEGVFSSKGSVLNKGDISGFFSNGTNASFQGMVFLGDPAEERVSVLANCGTINLTSIDDQGFSGLAGMSIINSLGSVLSNCGSISLSLSNNVNGANLLGMNFVSSYCTAVNCGNITLLSKNNGMSGTNINGLASASAVTNTVINSGNITLRGEDEKGSEIATGITAFSLKGSFVKNRGVISVVSLNGMGNANLTGISLSGPSEVTNYGTCLVEASGGSSGTGMVRGIGQLQADSVLSNCGVISVKSNKATNNEATGISCLVNNYFMVSNCGEVFATASKGSGNNAARGVYLQFFSSDFMNCGRISVEVPGGNSPPSMGCLFLGSHSTITNCGLISASSLDAQSANIYSLFIQLQTLDINLLSGSRLIGETFINYTLGRMNIGRNLNLVFSGLPANFTLLESVGGAYIGRGDPTSPLVVLDTTGFALQSDVVVDLADAVFDGVSSGHSFCASRRYGFWAEGVASYRKRSERVSYHNEQGGLLLGYSTGLCEGVAGVFGGVIASSAEVTGHTQKAELTTSLLGLSYERDFACTVFGVAIAGGASSWENDRCVENNLAPLGFENAHSEPEGTFFAAQAHVSRCYSRFWGSPTLYGDVRYAGLYLGDYDEKGSEGNFKTKERDVDYLTARVVVEPTIENRYTCWSAAPFVGVVGRYQLRGNGVEGELVGTPIYFSQDVQRSCLAGLFGVEASGIWSTLEWSIRLEGMMDGTNGSRFLAHAGAEWSF